MAIAACLFGTAHCVGAPIDGQRVYHSGHITLYADPIYDVCDGSIDNGERFVLRTAEYLGVPPPDLIDFHLYSVPVGQIPGCGSWACTLGTTVVSGEWVHRHELVHAVALSWGHPPAFLLEGLAEALGPVAFDPYPNYRLQPSNRHYRLEDNLESIGFGSDFDAHGLQGYFAAADFVRYVIHVYGIDALHNWYGSLAYLSDALTTRQEFIRATGVPLDQALAEWRASPVDTDRRAPQMLQPLECYAPNVEVSSPETFEATHRLSRCSTNRFYPDHTGYGRDAINVTHAGQYEMSFDGPLPDGLEIEPCDRVTGSGSRAFGNSTIRLAEGRYYIAVTRNFDGGPLSLPSITVHWTLRRIGD